MSEMDQATAPEPGWQKGQTEQEPDLFATTTPSSGPTSPSSSDSSPADALRKLPPLPSSSPESSSSSSSDALSALIAESLQLISAVASLFTQKTFGVDAKMKVGEARAAARPIASLIARRVEIRRELAEATDATAAGASLMTYVERLFTARVIPPPAADRSVARPPAPSGVPLASEPRPAPPAPAPAPQQAPRPTIHEPSGAAVVGSGPARQAFLEGFDV